MYLCYYHKQNKNKLSVLFTIQNAGKSTGGLYRGLVGVSNIQSLRYQFSYLSLSVLANPFQNSKQLFDISVVAISF